jgi:flagellum-specific ATP synthase
MQQPFESLLRQTRQQTQRLMDLPAGIAQGRLRRVSGLMLEVEGLALTVGARAHVQALGPEPWVEAECTGFDAGISYLMALGEMQSLAPGAAVLPSTLPRRVDGRYAMLPGLAALPVGDQLLGRVVDGLGRPLDGLGAEVDSPRQPRPPFVNPLKRRPIDTALDTGVRALNAALTVGRGQRIGLFAGSGVGKSVLLSMLARNCQADVVVIALVGERSREVREFCDDYFRFKARERSVVVAAPADTSPLARAKAAEFASDAAVWFRDQGRQVVLIVDSLTRYAMAWREIGLGMGEAPVARGYPASVFAKLPAIVEATGNGENEQGSLTSIYTLLLEGDDIHDPVADAARGVFDGHVFLSRELADAGHYPAIDIERSISRVMPRVVGSEHLKAARVLKALISKYLRSRDMLAMGAYQRGTDAQLDFAIKHWDRINAFLQQSVDESTGLDASRDALLTLVRGAP